MIVFLTLCYCAVVALAVKFGVIKLTLFWKLSPALWMLLLFVILFLPMQWGAPGGTVNVLQYVVEIIPNVSGEVTEVPVEPLKPLQKGDVLFQIDPVPFQAKVNELEAQLAATVQNVEMLKASSDAAAALVVRTDDEVDVKKSEIESAAAKVVVAQTSVKQAETNLDKVTQLVADLKIQVAAGSREYDRQKELIAQNAGSQAELDRAEVQFTGVRSQLHAAESDLLLSQQSLASSRASLDADQADARGLDVQLKQLIDADLPRVKALAREAKLAAESMIGDEHTQVAEVRALLAAAQYDLDQTTVRAPSSGHVAFLSLRPGQRVANLPLRSWMAFVDHENSEITVTINQYSLRHVRPGQQAEVTLKIFPGKVFAATVNRIAYITSSGQLAPSGIIASTSGSESAEPMGVVLTLDDESIDPMRLAGGAKGSAAIYTDSMQATHVIRKVMIRMDAWTNFVVP